MQENKLRSLRLPISSLDQPTTYHVLSHSPHLLTGTPKKYQTQVKCLTGAPRGRRTAAASGKRRGRRAGGGRGIGGGGVSLCQVVVSRNVSLCKAMTRSESGLHTGEPGVHVHSVECKGIQRPGYIYMHVCTWGLWGCGDGRRRSRIGQKCGEAVSSRAGYAGQQRVWLVPVTTTTLGTVVGKDSCWAEARLVGGVLAATRSIPRCPFRAGVHLRTV